MSVGERERGRDHHHHHHAQEFVNYQQGMVCASTVAPQPEARWCVTAVSCGERGREGVKNNNSRAVDRAYKANKELKKKKGGGKKEQ